MYQIHGIDFSFNTTKLIYVAEALGLDYDYIKIDMAKGEHKSLDHGARHPLGKLPTLTHHGKVLFESGAICRYLANVAESPLYPINDFYKRALVDQWMDFFTAHLGRWLGTLLFEKRVKEAFFGKPADPKVIEESHAFISQQMQAVEKHLSESTYFAGEDLSIADLFAFAYIETTPLSEVSLEPYPQLQAWFKKIQGLPSVGAAQKKLGRG
ncbi:MAG: glutathione S-transferase family protein [Deltaproteobacteria bacterium]|nr:glutathione S-transferase family protein [Deltaproteobacteria bacterium]